MAAEPQRTGRVVSGRSLAFPYYQLQGRLLDYAT